MLPLSARAAGAVKARPVTAANVAHRAVEARLGGAEGEAVADAADRDRVAAAVEDEHAVAGRTADDDAGLDDAEADAAAVGARGRRREREARHGGERDQGGAKPV